MAGKRDFTTMPVRIISDARPSALDLRVLACVSMHDGMSLKKKVGRGCYATFATLTGEIGCDASNLSKSLKRLVDWGYVDEERQQDRRRKSYRVIFDVEDQRSVVGETANNPNEIVGRRDCENGENLPQGEQHYSSLKGLDTLEREKLNSPEGARFVAHCLPEKKDLDENVGAELAMFERAWGSQALPEEQVVERYEWLSTLATDFDPDDPNNQRAQRLYYAVDLYLWEHRLGPYAGEQSAEAAA